MIISHALSKSEEIPLDIEVDSIHAHIDRDELQCMTPSDATLGRCGMLSALDGQQVSKIYLRISDRTGHAERKLGISNGVIFKGRQVLIPESMRSDILYQLHQGTWV